MTRRPVMTTIMALGCVVSLAGVTGVFAAFTDRATTGPNSFESEDLGRAADLQIAHGTAAGGPISCGAFVDDLATGVLTISDASAAGGGGSTSWICLRNVGSATVSVRATLLDLIDTDTGCTGDEAAVDVSCGGGSGELGQHLSVLQAAVTCADGAPAGSQGPVPFMSLVGTPMSLGNLAPGASTCLVFNLTYQADEAEALIAQSDTVTWRFAFDGTTA
jgi:predicted ribosomally synthesized peptide with SipW-like signal peptide